ncbi:MAG: PadR family transcriptional regulator [Solirubrobacterales bacterium]
MHDAFAQPLHTHGWCEPHSRPTREERHAFKQEFKRRKMAAVESFRAEMRGETDAEQPRSRGRRGGRDCGAWGAGDFGSPRGFGGPGRGRRRKRGDVRAAILVLLNEEPRNGYQLMQEIEERSDGAWRPSPGSIYPALAQLEDEALVKADESEGRKVFVLTAEGKKHVEEHLEQLGEPWAELDEKVGEGLRGLRDQIRPLMGAVGQVMHNGSEADAKRVAEILADARKKIYGILADDTPQDN